jgi:tetratricopeptide (TPR) repeat protein
LRQASYDSELHKASPTRAPSEGTLVGIFLGGLLALLMVGPSNFERLSSSPAPGVNPGSSQKDREATRKPDPVDAIGYNNRGNSYRNYGDYDSAIADYTEAIRIDPKNASAYEERGDAYYLKGDYDRAISDYTGAIQIDPRSDTYESRGYAHAAKGDYDTAIEDYTEAIRINPKGARAYVDRGDAYRAKGDFVHAFAEYATAIQFDPKGASSYESRAYANFYTAKYDAAALDFARVVEAAPHDLYDLFWLYLARARSGNQIAVSELETNAAKLSDLDWPYPLAELFLARGTPEATTAAASTPRDRCAAEFFVGEWYLLRENRVAAMDRLKAAAEKCQIGADTELYEGALAELKRLER